MNCLPQDSHVCTFIGVSLEIVVCGWVTSVCRVCACVYNVFAVVHVFVCMCLCMCVHR